MSLGDEIALYTELSGNDGNHTPVGIIGAYLDGYEKGKASAQEHKTGYWIPVSTETVQLFRCSECGLFRLSKSRFCLHCGSYNGG